MNYETASYLCHHGVKGMKWGVRRYQNKNGKLTALGKKRYSDGDSEVTKQAKTSRYDKLYNQYKAVGYSDVKAQEQAKGRVKVERTLKIIGGATVAAAVAYGAYKYYDSNADRFISPNKMLQTVHTGDINERIKPGNPFYASYTKRDNTIYASRVFSHFKEGSKISTLKTKEGIKVASEKSARNVFKSLCDSDPKVAEYARSIGIKDLNSKRAYKRFNYSLVLRNDSPTAKQMGLDKLDHDGIHQKFYEALKKNGYGAVIDTNDSKTEGFTWNPVIVFDNQVKQVVSSKVADKELGGGRTAAGMVSSLARMKVNKGPSAKTLAIGGLGAGYSAYSVRKSNKELSRKAEFAEKYRKEHPNTKLTPAQINRLYNEELRRQARRR